MIAIGVIIMLLGFLGCCGAIKENRCLLLLVRSPAFGPLSPELIRAPGSCPS